MKTSIIVAVAANNIIGKNNQIPWYLPSDLKHFKNTTTGHHIIMGRKNYEAMDKPLPNRTNIVITRQKNYVAEGCIVVPSIQDGLNIAKNNGEQEAFIIGGGEIYRQAISITDTIYLTKIYETFEGDVFFPELNMKNWQEISRKDFHQDEKNKYAYSIFVYEKK